MAWQEHRIQMPVTCWYQNYRHRSVIKPNVSDHRYQAARIRPQGLVHKTSDGQIGPFEPGSGEERRGPAVPVKGDAEEGVGLVVLQRRLCSAEGHSDRNGFRSDGLADYRAENAVV